MEGVPVCSDGRAQPPADGHVIARAAQHRCRWNRRRRVDRGARAACALHGGSDRHVPRDAPPPRERSPGCRRAARIHTGRGRVRHARAVARPLRALRQEDERLAGGCDRRVGAGGWQTIAGGERRARAAHRRGSGGGPSVAGDSASRGTARGIAARSPSRVDGRDRMARQRRRVALLRRGPRRRDGRPGAVGATAVAAHRARGGAGDDRGGRAARGDARGGGMEGARARRLLVFEAVRVGAGRGRVAGRSRRPATSDAREGRRAGSPPPQSSTLADDRAAVRARRPRDDRRLRVEPRRRQHAPVRSAPAPVATATEAPSAQPAPARSTPHRAST